MLEKFYLKYKIYLGIFCLLSLVLLCLVFQQRPDGLLHLIFYDVGEGDGILIKAPSGELIIIDGGPSAKITYDLPQDISFFKRKLDLGIVTHPHADHLIGFIKLAERYDFEKVFFADHGYYSKEQKTLIELLKETKKETIVLNQEDRIKIKELNLEVIWPKPDYNCDDNINNCSVVIRLDYGKFCAYFLGDAEKEVQESLLQESLTICPVVKIAHHGAENGFSETFIDKVKSQVAIISVGVNNRFNHPDQTTIEKLKNNKIKIDRTDEKGKIEIISNGQKWWIKTEK